MEVLKINKNQNGKNSYLRLNNTGLVYKIVFTNDDDMVYIGSSKTFKTRCILHVSDLKRGSTPPLYEYMRSKGYNFVDNVEFHVLEHLPETATKHEKHERERHHIMTYEKKTNLLNYIRPLEDILKCPHGKERRTRCKECYGTSICKHDRVQTVCKECNGGGICEHSRERSVCKECKGGGLCEHSRRRSKCTLCGTGGGICEHKKLKVTCKDCKGSGRCTPHNKLKQYCKECSTWNFCIEHGGFKNSKGHSECTFPVKE